MVFSRDAHNSIPIQRLMDMFAGNNIEYIFENEGLAVISRAVFGAKLL